MFLSGLEMDSSMELLSVQVSQCFRLLEYKSGYSKYLARCSFCFKMSPKLIHSLSGDEIRKECIKLGLSGRFTMKEALVEVATALVRSGKDPRTHQFYPSQPLHGNYHYQVVISSEIVETMKVLPTSMSACLSPQISVKTSPLATKTTASASQVPIYSPSYPPPNVTHCSVVKSESNVLEKILTTLEEIHDVLEKKPAVSSDETDSEFESFTSAAFSTSSDLNCMSQMSSFPTSFSSDSSKKSSSSTRWSKDRLREEHICIKFQHGSCKNSDDHPEDLHLCAKCCLSFDELLESDHGADWCPYY
jgi:hypothetical protein